MLDEMNKMDGAGKLPQQFHIQRNTAMTNSQRGTVKEGNLSSGLLFEDKQGVAAVGLAEGINGSGL